MGKSSAYKPIQQMQCCPYCGCDEFFIRQRASGVVERNLRFDGNIPENTELDSHIYLKTIGRYAYCADCRKRLFLLDTEEATKIF